MSVHICFINEEKLLQKVIFYYEIIIPGVIVKLMAFIHHRLLKVTQDFFFKLYQLNLLRY